MRARTLLTGGTGFLGRAVAARLRDARVVGAEQLDFTDGRAVAQLVADLQPEVVIHLAARVGGITANLTRPADFLIDNLRMDANLLAALRVHRPSHLVSMLSTCMYPDELSSDSYPMTEERIEDGPPPPTNAAYAAAKRALWRGTRALHEQYGVPYTALVPANLYGPGDHFGASDSHFIAAAVDRIERARRGGRSRVEFMGTGRALRQYVLVDDLARLIEHLVCTGPLNASLNVAPESCASIRTLAMAVGKAAGYEGAVAFTGEGPDGQFRKDVTSARLRAAVPAWQDMETPLAEGLERTILWYREHVEAR